MDDGRSMPAAWIENQSSASYAGQSELLLLAGNNRKTKHGNT
jgi:hypothetical protein